jgi:hypothetical protein
VRRFVLFGFLLASIAGVGASTAQPKDKTVARIGQVVVEIPSGFSGPHREVPTPQSEIQNYMGLAGDGLSPTAIQLTHIVTPQASSDLSEQTRFLAACDFLDGFMGAFRRNVRGWSRTPNERIRFDGSLGARATWSGQLNGVSVTGVMYLIVLGKDSYSFHVFGDHREPNASLKASIQAIESLRMEAANTSLGRTRER